MHEAVTPLPAPTMKSTSLTRALPALIIALASLTLCPGCVLLLVGAGAGAGTVAYVRGELSDNVDYGIEAATRAAAKAVEQLHLVKVSERTDALLGVIVARTGDDKKVEIRLERVGDSVTRIRIRVGTFGEQPLSQALLDKIHSDL